MILSVDVSLGQKTGPLQGLKVVELAGIGPGPHACMILADLGADVIRIDRPSGSEFGGSSTDLLNRGRPSVALDLKNPAAAEVVLELVAQADVLIEGMRPGAAEKLGLGPEDCLARNPKLVYGRMTGWGQSGTLAHSAGHDMNYISIAGALFGLGQDPKKPHFPMNLVGDFGGGSTYLIIGILAALLESKISGKGQVVDAAIVDGTAHLNTMSWTLLAGGLAQNQRVSGLLDGGTPFYDLYETADGRHVSVAPLEGKFYAEMVELLELTDLPERYDLAKFGELRQKLTEKFASKTLAEWAEIFEGTDACVAPVLTLPEAAQHPHNQDRQIFVEHNGALQPAPAPRFSRTEATLSTPPRTPGQDTTAALTAWGVANVADLLENGIAVQK